MAHDTAVLGADAALRYTTGDGFENINLYSSVAENSAQRIAKGDSAGDIIKDSAFEIGANVVTVGTYNTFKEQFSVAADYLSGNISSIDEVEGRLIHAAGGAVLNAGLGAVGAKVAGEGWLGKPVSAPKPSVVLEGVSQLPGRARAAAGNVAARARSAYGRVKTVLQSEVQIKPQFNVASSFGAGSIKIKLVPPKAAAKSAAKSIEYNVAPHGQQPRPSSPFASHHGVEKGYLKRNVAGYSERADPTIMLRDTAGGPHRRITGRQASERAQYRRSTGSRHGGDYGQRRAQAIEQMQAQGVPEPRITEWLLQHEGYMFEIGVPWQW